MNWDEYFMRHVYLAASKSKDPRTRIGAVLVQDNVIISEGYNGFPRGISDQIERYNDRETKLKYVCHAEANAVINCARTRQCAVSATCYTQGIPCINCCKTLIQAGISRLVIHKQWDDMALWKDEQDFSRSMLTECNIPVIIFDQELTLTGLNNGKELQV